jgi:hypothetical protein
MNCQNGGVAETKLKRSPQLSGYRRDWNCRELRVLDQMTAIEFCERVLLNGMEPDEQRMRRQARGYRAECVRLLAEVLGKPERTVSNWGDDFAAMPADLRILLACIYTLILLKTLVLPQFQSVMDGIRVKCQVIGEDQDVNAS